MAEGTVSSCRMALSVMVITLNEAPRLAACLRSVGFADEWLVIDSGSEDGTQALARSLGARVIEQPWLGYGRQKQFGVARAQHDWVLCLDADECVSAPLAALIERALINPEAAGFACRRCNWFLGRPLRHGEGYPDWSLRLFDRRRGGWRDEPVHEGVTVAGPVRRLPGDLQHDSAESLHGYLAKQNRYTTLQAEHWLAAGRSASVARLVLSPLLRFIKFYCLRGGFRDGVPGLVHVVIGCANSFFKYAKLRSLRSQVNSARSASDKGGQ